MASLFTQDLEFELAVSSLISTRSLNSVDQVSLIKLFIHVSSPTTSLSNSTQVQVTVISRECGPNVTRSTDFFFPLGKLDFQVIFPDYNYCIKIDENVISPDELLNLAPGWASW